jgi:hypothetical protein
MGFFITEEKELPEFSNQDANKVLKVDSSGLYLQWLQETTAPAELPPQTVAGILRTNGTVASWLPYANNLSNWLRSDGAWVNVRQVPSSGAANANRVLVASANGSIWTPNLFTDGTTGSFVEISSTLNLSRAGSAAEPTLIFNDNTATPAASRTGIWGSDNVIRFGTDGTERVTIRNDGLTVPDGSTAAPSYSFENSTNSGLVRTLVGTDNGIGFVANGTQVCSVVGGNFRLSGGASIRNNVSNPSANIQFIGNTGGATGHIQMTFSDSITGTVATYRLGNGTNWPATETVMSRLAGGTGTNEIFATEHGNTYFRFLGATGTGATLPTRVQRVEINNSGMSITGDLTVSGRATIPDVVYPFDVFTSTGSTADFSLAQSTRSNVRLEMDTFNTILRFPALVEGTFYRIVPFRNGTTATLSFRPGNNINMYLYSGGSRSVVTGNAGGTNGFSVLPGTFYECIYGSGAWYIVAQHPIANCTLPADVSVGGNLTVTGSITTGAFTLPNPVVVNNTIEFVASGGAAKIQGSNLGANSNIVMIIDNTASTNFTKNDTEVQNTLRLFKAPSTDFIIHDNGTHTVSRNSPNKIVLTIQQSGSSSAVIVFPVSTDVPNGLEIQVFVWRLSGRNGTGVQQIRFDSTSPTNNAFVLGSSGTGIALGGTTYTVTEGTMFKATNFRTTIGRWMVDSTRFNSTPALTSA